MKKHCLMILTVLFLLTGCSGGSQPGTLPVVIGNPRETTLETTTEREFGANAYDFSKKEWDVLSSFLNWHVDRIACMFLTSSYQKPEEIDFNLVFYNGVSGSMVSMAVPQEEKEAVAKAINMEGLLEMGLPIQKRPRSTVIELIQKYTGLSKEAAEMVKLDYPYVAEYDAYYSFYSDSEVIKPKLKQAVWLDEAHTHAQVEWEDSVRGRSGVAEMAFTESGWIFLANRIESTHAPSP